MRAQSVCTIQLLVASVALATLRQRTWDLKNRRSPSSKLDQKWHRLYSPSRPVTNSIRLFSGMSPALRCMKPRVCFHSVGIVAGPSSTVMVNPYLMPLSAHAHNYLSQR